MSASAFVALDTLTLCERNRGMREPAPSVRSVIADLGGRGPVSELIGCGDTAVLNWISRDAFPAWTFFKLRNALVAAGKPVPEDLWKKERAPRRRARKQLSRAASDETESAPAVPSPVPAEPEAA